MSQPEQPDPAVVRNNRLQLVIIVVIAALSLGGSYLLFFAARDSGVWGTTNHGDFIDPPVTVSDLVLIDGNGVTVAPASNWWLWVVSATGCDTHCSGAVFEMRQLHVLLNKDAERVRRALIAPEAANAGLDEPYPKLARWQLGRDNQQALQPGIYIVDPIGNLVFRYALESPGKPVLEDLKRLLKVSQIG